MFSLSRKVATNKQTKSTGFDFQKINAVRHPKKTDFHLTFKNQQKMLHCSSFCELECWLKRMKLAMFLHGFVEVVDEDVWLSKKIKTKVDERWKGCSEKKKLERVMIIL